MLCSAITEPQRWQHQQKVLPNMLMEGEAVEGEEKEEEQDHLTELMRKHNLWPNGKMMLQLEKILLEEAIANRLENQKKQSEQAERAKCSDKEKAWQLMLCSGTSPKNPTAIESYASSSGPSKIPTIREEARYKSSERLWSLKLPHCMKTAIHHFTSRNSKIHTIRN